MLKTRNMGFVALVLLFVSTLSANATQNTDIVDSTFNAQIQTSRFDFKGVQHLVTLHDGKILVSGAFNRYNGESVGCLIRLNAEGSLDTTFNNDLLKTGSVINSITLQPDGKILLEGDLTLTDGTVYTKTIVRLNSNGTIDNSFKYSFTGTIYEIKIDSTGRILVSGGIKVSDNNYKPIIRLNDNGSLDSSFNVQISTGIDRFSTQNNKILYTRIDVQAQQFRLHRLNEDGTEDASFPSMLVGNPFIKGMKTVADNKILMMSDHKLFRILENGGIDPDFQSTTTFSPSQPNNLFVQSDGRITTAITITGGLRIIRFLPDGTSDPSFIPYDAIGVGGYTVQPDGAILLGDRATSSNDFKKLLPSGMVDTSFNPGGSGFFNIVPGKIRAITILPDEKILIGGHFDKVGNGARLGIARLNPDSTLDTTFQVSTSGTGNYFTGIRDIYQFVPQSDGKIIISGNFDYLLNGTEKSNFVRINSNGSIDQTFNLSVVISDLYFISNGGYNRSIQMPNGKILVGTSKITINDTRTIPPLLDATGSKDTSFNPTLFNTKNNAVIHDVALHPNGKVLIAGFHVVNTLSDRILKGFVIRLNSDGSVDQGFQAAELVDKRIYRLKMLSNGQMLTASTIYNGSTTQSNISRLNSDGTVDNSFNSAIVANGIINDFSVLPNNKIVVGGAFSTYGNQLRGNLALLNADGTLDQGLGNTNHEVFCTAVDKQGRVLIGGSFTSISSVTQNAPLLESDTQQVEREYLARLIVSSDTTTRRQSYFDFDGDGRSDISVFRPSTGSWYLLQSSNSSFFGQSFGIESDVITPADFDGDGKTDFAVFRPDTGNWYLQQSTSGFTAVQFGQSGDIPVPSDYDGDGEADIAVFRPSTGGWYRLNSSNGQFVAVGFGIAEDKPTIGDYDGDSKADIAVFRPSTGSWYRLNSSNNQFVATQFGVAEDKPTPADFDGDGKTDIAVFRPSTGGWYRLNSSNGEFVAVGFGFSEDRPVPADYDGDGKADIAVFRPSDGNWYVLRSTAGFAAVQFGQANDKPVPNAFVP